TLKPDFIEVYINLGEMYIDMGKFDLARQHLQKAKTFPDAVQEENAKTLKDDFERLEQMSHQAGLK
ncbi:MAG: tetratricopeptide repeat protein, partial [Candidatus Obscuribacterales bacterium]|nr:tetratricopeptide repeat protein [Candidatus Obscuribacterales bacterium]